MLMARTPVRAARIGTTTRGTATGTLGCVPPVTILFVRAAVKAAAVGQFIWSASLSCFGEYIARFG